MTYSPGFATMSATTRTRIASSKRETLKIRQIAAPIQAMAARTCSVNRSSYQDIYPDPPSA
jgi:hypothetical protein